jgi:hypothetical protein
LNKHSTPESRALVSGVRLTGRERAIALQLGNGNLSQGVRYALRHAAQERTTTASLSTILRSAARMAEAMERCSG